MYNETVAEGWLRLALTPGMDMQSAHALLSEFGEPQNVLSLTTTKLSTLIPQPLASRLRHPDTQTRADIEQILSWLAISPNARLITLADPDYPSRFLTVPEPPLAVLAMGNVDLLVGPTLSLTGSEKPNQEGIQIAQSWAQVLARKPISLVQGDAEGIERHALIAALKSCPQHLVYVSKISLSDPKIAQQSSFVANDGLALSLVGFARDDEALWRARHRLLAACCEYFVVVQAAARAKSLTLMREMADVNRTVMAVPGSIHSPLSKGCHQLIKQGARLVESVDDILFEINLNNI